MEHRTYRLAVRRHRGQWRASVPELAGRDAPRFTVRKLDNLAPEAIGGIAGYLGVSPAVVDVDLTHPVKPTRKLPLPSLAQVAGGVVALSGVYLLAGVAATLLVAGVVVAALGVLRESGRI